MSHQAVLLRDDISIHGWPGTMGGLTKRILESSKQKEPGSKLVSIDGDPSYMRRIVEENKWSEKYQAWYYQLLNFMGVLEGEVRPSEASQEDNRDNDISLLPTKEINTQPILRAFEATTKSDSITNKRIIVNPEFEMTLETGISLAYYCANCKKSTKLEVVTPEDLITKAFRDDKCRYRLPSTCECDGSDFIVQSGTRTVVNWYKVLVTINNDLDRIRAFMSINQSEVDNWISTKVNDANEGGTFAGNIHTSLLDEKLVEELVVALHKQYKYSMLGIIIGVSDAGHALELPEGFVGFSNPVEHWHKKRHVMSDLWWNNIKGMLESTPECEKDCIICSRYKGEDWHDVATHIGQCDVYGRLHHGTDIFSLSWVERMMVTASYWDELGNKDQHEVLKAKTSIGKACIDVALGRDVDFDQRMAKQRCLLNLNTYTLRRCLNESRYLAENGLGAMRVGKMENLEQMIRGRLFEGMTLPYVEDDMIRKSCTDCADMIVLAGQLGIVFHDAIDLPNDLFNCEYMNVYRMAASGGYDSLIRFTKGAHTLLKAMATIGAKSICCGSVLQAALGNTVGWYFYCARYNYCSNVQKVYAEPYPWSSLIDYDAACWVGRLLGCNERTLEKIKEWVDLPLISHEEFGCGNHHPKKRFNHMRAAILEGKIVDADTAEIESAQVFCELAAAGRLHKRGVAGNCLCCEVIYECAELTILGDMVGRFVHHALRLGTGKIAMVIDC